MRTSSSFTLAFLLFTISASLASCQLVGGYTRLTDAQFASIKVDPNFQPILNAAKAYAQANVKSQCFRLGTLKYIDIQIVSGVNYKLTYKNRYQEITQIVVYNQPWTNTILVLSLERFNVRYSKSDSHL